MREVVLRIPIWIKQKSNDHLLRGEDLVPMFGVPCSRSLTREVARGNIPKPDVLTQNRFKRPCFNWTLEHLKQYEGQTFTLTPLKGRRI